jgi:hypothetical protein
VRDQQFGVGGVDLTEFPEMHHGNLKQPLYVVKYKQIASRWVYLEFVNLKDGLLLQTFKFEQNLLEKDKRAIRR